VKRRIERRIERIIFLIIYFSLKNIYNYKNVVAKSSRSRNNGTDNSSMPIERRFHHGGDTSRIRCPTENTAVYSSGESEKIAPLNSGRENKLKSQK
jgi:hypothetical protein